jgi:2-succinyl-6-hydroxy-2,4-cyclohexadiene-1-carboxylate synthase
MLHGFTGAPSSFDTVVERLTPGHSTLRPALVGHDGTDGDPRIQSFDDQLDVIASKVADWTPSPAFLVGYSLGARVSLGLLVRHPALFAGAALIGVHPGLDDSHERAARRVVDDRWCELLDTGGIAAFTEVWSAQPLFSTQRALDPALLEKQQRTRLSHSARGLSASLRVLGLGVMPSYGNLLQDIHRPVHLLVGEEDRKFVALSDTLLGALPRGRLHRIRRAGHNLLLEAPAEVASIIRKEIEP